MCVRLAQFTARCGAATTIEKRHPGCALPQHMNSLRRRAMRFLLVPQRLKEGHVAQSYDSLPLGRCQPSLTHFTTIPPLY